MPLLTSPDALKVGTSTVDKLYLGSSQVWSNVDPDVAAFYTASGITDATQKAAVAALVAALKTAGVWTKLAALYPFVGGSASTHKWNLKDPRDLDAAYRLTFTGSYTHNSGGLVPDGVSTYADTHAIDDVVGSASSLSFGVYSRTQGQHAMAYDMGAGDATDTKASICIPRYGNGLFFATVGTSGYTSNTAESDGRGFFAVNRPNSTNTEGYKNGSRVINAADTVTLAHVSFYLTAHHRGTGPAYFGQKTLGLAYISIGLSQAEHAALYTAVQAFQTTLGRNV